MVWCNNGRHFEEAVAVVVAVADVVLLVSFFVAVTAAFKAG